MKTGDMIHWYEGLFLQPHHFQKFQKSVEENLIAVNRNFHPYPYGIISAKLNEEALENFIIQFNELNVVMPDGRVVSYPGNTTLSPLNIKNFIQEQPRPTVVYLALPLHTEAGSNTIEQYERAVSDQRLFRVEEKEVRDENTGENPQIIQIRKYNARIVIGEEKNQDTTLLPLMEIIPSHDEPISAPPLVSKKFIPPVLTIHASLLLKLMTSELYERCKTTREDLLAQLNRSGYNPELLSGTQLDKILRLQIVNKYTGWLEHALTERSGIHPVILYTEMRKMLGELAALQPGRDLFSAPYYDHDNSYHVFNELFSRIRSLISSETSGSYVKIDFRKASELPENIWIAELSEEHILKAEEYFIAVQFRGEAANIASIIETGDQFKLMPVSMVNQRVRGVKLKEERYPPSILPALPNVIFFRLLRAESQRAFNLIRDEQKVAAVWSEKNFPGMTVTLFITIFEEKKYRASFLRSPDTQK